jgi:hypothetical protein
MHTDTGNIERNRGTSILLFRTYSRIYSLGIELISSYIHKMYQSSNKRKFTEVNRMSMNYDYVPNTIQYTIQAGDSLWNLSDQFNIAPEYIMAANPGINLNALNVGQVISIPDNQLSAEQFRRFGPGFRRPFFREPFEFRRPFFRRRFPFRRFRRPFFREPFEFEEFEEPFWGWGDWGGWDDWGY